MKIMHYFGIRKLTEKENFLSCFNVKEFFSNLSVKFFHQKSFRYLIIQCYLIYLHIMMNLSLFSFYVLTIQILQ